MNAYDAHNVENMLIDTRAAAQLIGIKPQSLRLMRSQRRGPNFSRLDGPGIRYRVRDVIDWIADNRVE